ncbi:MAG: iron ABC transporter permease, partial [Muribaculaceae bacterium]|nr:iron ABC transporter permease [Muribaculaceae bacterium]
MRSFTIIKNWTDCVRRHLFIILSVLLPLLFILDIAVGSVSIPLAQIWAALTGGECSETVHAVIIDIRLQKAVVALIVGAALSVSGLEMQTLFRNPLAGPYVLGISSGASLGVAIFILGAPLLGISGILANIGMAGAAWIGAALILVAVAAVGRRVKDIMVILILGMMFSSGVGAVVQIMQYLSSEESLKAFVVWSMGSLGDVTSGRLIIMGASVAVGLALAIHAIKPLNLLLFG